MTKIFPSIIIVLSIGAAIVYFVNHDPRLGVYWLAGAVLNLAAIM